jgi:methylmalonyl-CoA/ethylmalonyl-CoA epimerase
LYDPPSPEASPARPPESAQQENIKMKPVQAINHIGIAVRSIADQRSFYEETLGAVFEGVEEVADQKVRVGFFRIGDVRLELLEPSDPSSTIATFLDKKGEGLHHVAYTVDNIESRISELKERGVRMIDDIPRPGAHHTRIAFLHPKSSCSILTELCEPLAGRGPDKA